MRKIIAITLLLVAGLASAQDLNTLFQSERDKILALRDAGKLTELEAAIDLESTGRAYFPNEPLLRAYDAAIIGYAERFERGEIDKTRFVELVDMRTARVNEAAAKKNQSENANYQQQQADRIAAENQARQSGAIGNFLRGMANSMNRNYPRPITCASTAMPGVVTTNCQ